MLEEVSKGDSIAAKESRSAVQPCIILISKLVSADLRDMHHVTAPIIPAHNNRGPDLLLQTAEMR